jgi:hypothetical protein
VFVAAFNVFGELIRIGESLQDFVVLFVGGGGHFNHFGGLIVRYVELLDGKFCKHRVF